MRQSELYFRQTGVEIYKDEGVVIFRIDPAPSHNTKNGKTAKSGEGDHFIEWGCYGREFEATRRLYKTANHRQLSTFANVELSEDFFNQVGRETLRLENQFNEAAGIADEDNALPQFFYDEALPPRNLASRFSLDDINEASRAWWN